MVILKNISNFVFFKCFPKRLKNIQKSVTKNYELLHKNNFMLAHKIFP
jgi:hypothetical protein